MKIPLYQVDAFTTDLFRGNPAAVCPLSEWLDKELMQKIAAENNLSETAFFVETEDGFDLKWFTPRIEVNLCGHATLASAHVLFKHLNYREERIRFSTISGVLTVTREGDLYTLDFPSSPAAPVDAPPELAEGLGKIPLDILKSRDYLALFEKEDDIVALKPDFTVLQKLDCIGIIVTAPGTSCDFVSRFFAPAAGINEDPVTGSAHTTLIPFWAVRLGKDDLHANQISERQGELFCHNRGDRVHISGKAVTYLQGVIEI